MTLIAHGLVLVFVPGLNDDGFLAYLSVCMCMRMCTECALEVVHTITALRRGQVIARKASECDSKSMMQP